MLCRGDLAHARASASCCSLLSASSGLDRRNEPGDLHHGIVAAKPRARPILMAKHTERDAGPLRLTPADSDTNCH